MIAGNTRPTKGTRIEGNMQLSFENLLMFYNL
jgi:hypothetical protein